MSISLSGTRITVQFESGDPKGDSWNDPYTLDDVVTAIENVTKQGNQIYIPYSLYIIGADTHFLAEDMQVCLGGNPTDIYSLYINANFKSQGNIKGMQWINNDFKKFYSNSNFTEIINSIFANFSYFHIYASASISKSTFLRCWYPYFPYNTDKISMEDVVWQNSCFGLQPKANFLSITRIKLMNNIYGITLEDISYNITNLKLINNTYALYFRPQAINTIINLTDSQIDTDSYIINNSFTGDVILNLISTFKINIENGNGGTAKLYDKDDNLIWTEALSGELEKLVTYHKHYVETDGALVADEKTTYEPFKLVISKANYLDLTIPNINIKPGEEVHKTGKLVKPTYFHQAISGKVEVSEVSGRVTVSEVSGTITQ